MSSTPVTTSSSPGYALIDPQVLAQRLENATKNRWNERLLLYFAAVLAANEALTNSGAGL